MGKIDFTNVSFMQVAKCNMVKKSEYKFLGFAKPELKNASIKLISDDDYKVFGEMKDGTILCEPNPDKKGKTFKGLFVGDVNLPMDVAKKYNLDSVAIDNDDEENDARIESSYTEDEIVMADGDMIEIKNLDRILIAYFKVDKTTKQKIVLLPDNEDAE